MIERIERWDALELEYNPDTPNPFKLGIIESNRDIMQKLWQREMKLCEKDAPELHAELEELWTQYLERRRRVVTHSMEVSTRLQNFDWG